MHKYFVVLLLLTSSVAFGLTVIDSGRRNNLEFLVNDENDNSHIDVNHNDECPNLTPELIEEIKSHQTVVNDIVHAIVNGTYSGDTWNA